MGGGWRKESGEEEGGTRVRRGGEEGKGECEGRTVERGEGRGGG